MLKEEIKEKLISFKVTNRRKWLCPRTTTGVLYKEIIIDCDDTYAVHVKHIHTEFMDVIAEGICIVYHTDPLKSGIVHAISNEFIIK